VTYVGSDLRSQQAHDRSTGARLTTEVCRCHTGGVRNEAVSVDEELVQSLGGPGDSASDDELIRRATADRKAGRNTTHDVDELLSIAAKRNHAALDRLAK
jgi:hypothetical protein